jgi:cyanophycinase
VTQPIYLLADSQLLFWKGPDGQRSRLREWIASAGLTPSTRAAYIGASNGDLPAYYEIFTAAMTAAGIAHCSMVRAAFSADDEANLARADIILLAGGNVERGWHAIAGTGMHDLILRRYAAGAMLLGISAGAVQLGLHGTPERGVNGPQTLFDTFQLCPFVVGAHDEERNWQELADTVRLLGGRAKGLGVRTGGGVIAYGDGTIEAVRHPVDELAWTGGEVARHLLLPPD